MMFFKGKLKWLALIVLLIAVIGACNKSDQREYLPTPGDKPSQLRPEYVIAIHPLHNPQHLMVVYGPIVDYLNKALPEARFKLEASRNYAEFEKKLYAGQFAFAMPNPYQTVNAVEHGYRVFGKMGDDDNFRGLILVRKDGQIKQLGDLIGKSVSYPAATALAATMMPQYFLYTQGIDVNRDIKNLYVGSQESSIMNVLRGDVAAGATWPVPWRAFEAEHPEMASQLVVKWTTFSLPNNGWVVRGDVPPALVEKVAHLLFNLDQSESGRKLLAPLVISRFEPANEETYRPVREFLATFSRTVRPIP